MSSFWQNIFGSRVDCKLKPNREYCGKFGDTTKLTKIAL